MRLVSASASSSASLPLGGAGATGRSPGARSPRQDNAVAPASGGGSPAGEGSQRDRKRCATARPTETQARRVVPETKPAPQAARGMKMPPLHGRGADLPRWRTSILTLHSLPPRQLRAPVGDVSRAALQRRPALLAAPCGQALGQPRLRRQGPLGRCQSYPARSARPASAATGMLAELSAQGPSGKLILHAHRLRAGGGTAGRRYTRTRV